MEDKDRLDLEKIKKQFLEEFRSGKPTFSKDGALAPILKHFLESALDAEMDLHLDEEERVKGNRRTGKARILPPRQKGSIKPLKPSKLLVWKVYCFLAPPNHSEFFKVQVSNPMSLLFHQNDSPHNYHIAVNHSVVIDLG